MRLRYSKLQEDADEDRDGNLWNEVNFYVGPGDGGLEHVLWKNLLGVVHIRADGDEDVEANERRMRHLAKHFRSLGAQVPMFSLHAEPVEVPCGRDADCRLERSKYPVWWRREKSVDLTAAPYNLEEVQL